MGKLNMSLTWFLGVFFQDFFSFESRFQCDKFQCSITVVAKMSRLHVFHKSSGENNARFLSINFKKEFSYQETYVLALFNK